MDGGAAGQKMNGLLESSHALRQRVNITASLGSALRSPPLLLRTFVSRLVLFRFSRKITSLRAHSLI